MRRFHWTVPNYAKDRPLLARFDLLVTALACCVGISHPGWTQEEDLLDGSTKRTEGCLNCDWHKPESVAEKRRRFVEGA